MTREFYEQHWLDLLINDGFDEPQGVNPYKSSPTTNVSKYDGDRLKWDTFVAEFHAMVHNTFRPPEEKLLKLRQALTGDPRRTVENVGHGFRGYRTAWRLLRDEYGCEEDQRRLRRETICKLPPVAPNNVEALAGFSRDICGMLEQLHQQGAPDLPALMADVEDKLPNQERKEWRNWAAAHGDHSAPAFSQWLRWQVSCLRRLDVGRSRSAQPSNYAKSQVSLSSHETEEPRSRSNSRRPREAKTNTTRASSSSGRQANRQQGAGFGSRSASQVTRASRASVQPDTREPLPTPTVAPPCLRCSNRHALKDCPTFASDTVGARWDLVQRGNACHRCLEIGHYSRECKRPTCKEPGCGQRHHYLLHRHLGKPTTNHMATGCCGENQAKRVHFGLIKIQAYTARGTPIKLEAFLDIGSNTTFVSEAARKKAGWKSQQRFALTVDGAAGLSTTEDSGSINFIVKTERGDKPIRAFTLKEVTKDLGSSDWPEIKKRYGHLKDLPLCHTSGKPDLLIGNDQPLFHQYFECRAGGDNDPVAHRTVFGWVAHGPVLNHVLREFPEEDVASLLEETAHFHTTATRKHIAEVHHARLTEVQEIRDLAHRFYDGEEFGTKPRSQYEALSADQRVVADKLPEAIGKLQDQGYKANMVWRPNKEDLQVNLREAEQRFAQTMRKFTRDHHYEEEYRKAMSKYLEKGYAEVMYKYQAGTKITANDPRADPHQFFIPHHGVPKSGNRGLRIVFDSSAEKDGVSLNDTLYSGPKLQTELPQVLLRFREQAVAFSGDIEDMFSRIRLNPEDAKRHRFLWHLPDDPPDQISVVQMNRLPFGDTISPCLAIATLQRAAKDQTSDPGVLGVIISSMYVDDLLDSAATVAEANQVSQAVAEILGQGDFHLAKWTANHPEFKLQEAEFGKESTALGLRWLTGKDLLTVKETDLGLKMLTKRTILSKVAQQFSPLGLLSPFIVKAKIQLAQLHQLGVDWDDDLQVKADEETKTQPAEGHEGHRLWRDLVKWWWQWLSCIPRVPTTEFPRVLLPFKPIDLQYHAFGDASEHAFAAVVYVRATGPEGGVYTNIVMAKTRVAPRRSISIAKLELQAALLAVRLMGYVLAAVREPPVRKFYWTDSTCVRHWVRQTASFHKPFVANRIGEIQTETEPQEWRHLPGVLNPADEATRAELTTSNPLVTTRWIEGPSFLRLPEDQWPPDLQAQRCLEEIRPKYEFATFHVGVKATPGEWFDATRYSDLQKARRVMAYVILATQLLRRQTGTRMLTVSLFSKADNYLAKMAQEASYPLERKGTIKASSPIATLSPFLDEDGLLRVGGRLAESALEYGAKHPVILPPAHPYTQLVIADYHQQTNHAGANYVLGLSRARFWIVRGREAIKKFGNSCVVCKRARAQPLTQVMADLPPERVKRALPFQRISVDYFGPFTIAVSRNRTAKRWGCLFACMTTRAVHLELADSLSTPDFLKCFRTFCHYRGTPSYVYSDNGTNFVGAARELREAVQALTQDPDLQRRVAQDGLVWHFQPPSAPHFGGIHEALVKSAKSAITSAMEFAAQRRNLRESELRCLLVEVMGFLNSRPLGYVGTDPKDTTPLTPNTFLIHRPYGAAVPLNPRTSLYQDSYRLVQAVADHAWTVWHREYLPTLMTRAKWHRLQRDLRRDDVVLVVDQNAKRSQWILGRVEDVTYGKDGHVRQATVQTQGGRLQRPVVKLVLLLPAPEDETDS